jgi:hypothetical protein
MTPAPRDISSLDRHPRAAVYDARAHAEANGPRLITLESAFFLTTDELGTLTGFKTPARQVSWLRTKGWRFEINGNKRPVVARKYAEKMLGCGMPEEATYRPNFAALRGA